MMGLMQCAEQVTANRPMTEDEYLAAWQRDIATASKAMAKRDNPTGRNGSDTRDAGRKGGQRQMHPSVVMAICATLVAIEAGAKKTADLRDKVMELREVTKTEADRMIRTSLDRRMIAVIAKGSSPGPHNFYGLTDAGREFLAKNRGKA